jgi:hypothetical protein
VEKKIHSRKALIITNKEKKILYVSALFSGKTHDYELLKRSIPKNTDCLLAKEILVDLGFIGIKKDYKIENLRIPHKKKRVKKGESNELTKEQKEENKEIGRHRVGVEHAIGQIKNCRILHQTIRIKRLSTLDLIVSTAAALVNFRNT